MQVRIKSEDAGNLILERDVFSKGILNKDKAAYNEAIARHELAKQKKEQQKALETRVNNLEIGLGEIKSLLQQLLEK